MNPAYTVYSFSSYSYHSVTNNPNSTFDRTVREKEYDLNDHLGDVTLVFSDWKLDLGSSSYTADILNTNNYYPFGMLMPGYTNTKTGGTYRYGYNDKEKDDDIKGVGNSYDFDARMYDSRLGKFLSLDPLAKYFSALTPYQFSGNNPIAMTDLDGLEPAPVNPNTQTLVFILQGYGGDPPDGQTQCNNAGGDLARDEALGRITSSKVELQIVHYASSQTENTKNDVLKTINDFKKANPNGKVVIVGHSGGGDNAIELAKDNPQIKIDLLITLDTQDPKWYGIDDNNIPENVKNAINYYQITEPYGGETLDFSDKTKGVNIVSPGSNHRSIDNDQLGNVIRDILNAHAGKDAVKLAKERKQEMNDPKTSKSEDIDAPGKSTKGTINPKSSR